MHIPDGFLVPRVWIPAWGLAAAGLAIAMKKASAHLQERTVPLMGVTSAFIFVAQMVNFPVFGGTSGHLLGGVLAAALLGPSAAMIVLSCVLLVQCLIFQDGGLTALGANIVDMGFLAPLGGYLIYRMGLRIFGASRRSRLAAFGVAAWFSILLAAAGCALALALSGTSPFRLVFPAMLGVHVIVGLVEALVSVLILSFIIKVRPDLLYPSKVDTP